MYSDEKATRLKKQYITITRMKKKTWRLYK